MAAYNSQQKMEAPRLWGRESFIPFRLEPLTPVFVASNETLSPLDYAIRKEGNDYWLYFVDTSAWLMEARRTGAVSAALASGDMKILRRELNSARSLEKLEDFAVTRIAISRAVAENMRRIIDSNDSKSKAEIMGFMRNPLTRLAILPGSSIKGSLRTALIDELDRRNKAQGKATLKDASSRDGGKNSSNYDDAIKAMLGDIRESAMQALKVADLAIPPQGTEIKAVKLQPLHPKPGKASPPLPPCEALSIRCAPPIYGNLRLDCKNGKPAITLPDGSLVDLPTLAKICNDFYSGRFMRESEKFYQQPHLAEVRKNLAEAARKIKALTPQTGILLRVGHYSHIECVSVTNNKPDAKKGHGKTRAIAEGSLPLGWVILRFCPDEEYWQGVKAVDAAISAELDRVAAREAKMAAEAARAFAQKRQRDEMQAKIRAEEEARQNQAALAQAERATILADQGELAARIWDLRQPGCEEKIASDLFASLDSLAAGEKKSAACALKEYWQKIGKWSGKSLSKRQKEKTAAVRAILGE